MRTKTLQNHRILPSELLKTFPEAKNYILVKYPIRLKKIDGKIRQTLNFAQKIYRIILQHFEVENIKDFESLREFVSLIVGERMAELQLEKNNLKNLLFATRAKQNKKFFTNKVTEDQIQLARERPITQIYQFNKLTRMGERQKALCPFHQEKSPSFVIYADGSFYCFGCSIHGKNAIDFLEQLNPNLDFVKIVKLLSN